MTKDKALYQWFNHAVHDYTIRIVDGAAMDPMPTEHYIPAYPFTAVPEKAKTPYLTYTPVYSAWGEGAVSITVNLWYRTKAEELLDAVVQELSRRIGVGETIPCDGGYIWLKRGSPFAQPVADPDPAIKRRYINITAEYMTAD